MSTKAIDAVGMVREIRDAIYEETKDMNKEEFIAHIRRRAGNASPPVPSEQKAAKEGRAV